MISWKNLIGGVILSILEKRPLRGGNMPEHVPKKDGSGKGRGQLGKGCDGKPRKRKGKNK
jgi:hypothetical protein